MSRSGKTKLKVLFITPFSPVAEHDHAAAFTLAKLIPRLADVVDLTVFSPQGSPEETRSPSKYVLRGPASPPKVRNRRLGIRPAWLRKEWPTTVNAEVDKVVREVQPDVIHSEYLYPSEVALRWPNVVLGLRDNSPSVLYRSMQQTQGLAKVYRFVEYLRTLALERHVSRKASAIVALSESDAAHFARRNGFTHLIRPGVELPKMIWSPPRRARKILVFTGAMWRHANIVVAEMIAKEVMPLIWNVRPDVELRIVGAEPSRAVKDLELQDSRVRVTGRVPDLDDEMLAADGVVVPTILGGGVMIKVLRSLALGCPTVTSSEGARSVGASPREVLVGDDAATLARNALTMLDAPDEMQELGKRARSFVLDEFGWDRAVSEYLRVYKEVASR